MRVPTWETLHGQVRSAPQAAGLHMTEVAGLSSPGGAGGGVLSVTEHHWCTPPATLPMARVGHG